MVALGTHLYADARLQQTVSPQVVLQSQILELSADDLRERVQAELEENPALEMADDVHLLPALPRSAAPSAESIDALERLSAPYTLADDLRMQLARVSGVRREVCEYLIECLDERGFLEADLPETAALLDVKLGEVQAAVTALQSLEPAGIGARNLRESLLLQVERLPAGEVPPHAVRFISAYLSSDRRRNSVQTASALGLTAGDLSRIVRFISKRLYMWPAEQFQERRDSGVESEQLVFPDVWIDREGQGLRVKVAQSWSQSLRVSDAYARLETRLHEETCGSVEERDRLSEKVRHAREFIHHLTRRETMLKRVTEAIVASQREFFDDGPQALQPLTRKEIAASLQVHESTISRITRDKYLQLPNAQLVSFDYFFDGSLSAKAVLRHLIGKEDSRRPLADAVLAERLEAAGYPLARRTVAKYRDQLGIPPAHERKAA